MSNETEMKAIWLVVNGLRERINEMHIEIERQKLLTDPIRVLKEQAYPEFDRCTK